MKVLFMVGLLFCILVCTGCGNKQTEDEGEPPKKELTGECKAVEIFSEISDKYFICMFELLKQPSLFTATKERDCDNSIETEMDQLRNLHLQGEVSEAVVQFIESKFNYPEENNPCSSLSSTYFSTGGKDVEKAKTLRV